MNVNTVKNKNNDIEENDINNVVSMLGNLGEEVQEPSFISNLLPQDLTNAIDKLNSIDTEKLNNTIDRINSFLDTMNVSEKPEQKGFMDTSIFGIPISTVLIIGGIGLAVYFFFIKDKQ